MGWFATPSFPFGRAPVGLSRIVNQVRASVDPGLVRRQPRNSPALHPGRVGGFRDESGRKSDAQLMAFDDTWHWGPDAEAKYAYLTVTAQRQGRVPNAAVA